MKNRFVLGLAVVLLLLAAFIPARWVHSSSDPAYNTKFTTSITYQNLDSQPAQVAVMFFNWKDDINPESLTLYPLQNGDRLSSFAGASYYVGSTVDAGYRGSAIMQSDRKLAITMVQNPDPANTEVKVRLMSNASSAGASKVFVPSVLRSDTEQNSVFSIQNVDIYPATVTIKIYDLSGGNPQTIIKSVQPGAVYYYDAGDHLGGSFTGSAIVTAVREGTSTAGKIVVDIREYSVDGYTANAYEGATSGATNIYVPFAMCQAYEGYSTAYAIQNISELYPTNITVEFRAASGNPIYQYLSVPAGAKVSVFTCQTPGVYAGFTGAAKITSSSTNIIAVGKVYNVGASNAALGFKASDGVAKVALPYVRWTQSHWTDGTRQRTYIAIQNIGAATILANEISVKYYDKNGTLKATDTINQSVSPGQKVNSNPYWNSSATMAEFGYDPAYGGSAVVECTHASCQIVAIGRCSSYDASNNLPSEDYNGFPMP